MIKKGEETVIVMARLCQTIKKEKKKGKTSNKFKMS